MMQFATRSELKIAMAIGLLGVVFSVAILLLPSFLTAVVTTVINFVGSVVLVSLTIFVLFWLPRLKWVAAFVLAAFVAFPPYPNWIRFDDAGEVVLDVGNVSLESLGANLFLFLLSLVAVAILYYSVGVLVSGAWKVAKRR